MATTRLIEKWLPIAAIGAEGIRERMPMTPYPAPNRLHIWWARRPLVASRAAILASLLPGDADHDKFLHALGIHGDPKAVRRKIDQARRTGKRFEGEAYSYPRAFTYSLTEAEHSWITGELVRIGIDRPVVLDPTAGGGSIPFEAVRLGAATFANDLNPVAAVVLKATIAFPLSHGAALATKYAALAASFLRKRDERVRSLFPAEPEADAVSTNFLWARTIRCPYCSGLIPLSPNWRLAPGGVGVRLRPDLSTRVCRFEVVRSLAEQSHPTVTQGDAKCPFDDCGRVIDGKEVKEQAQSGAMSEQLFAVVFRRPLLKKTKGGKLRKSWQRDYRSPIPSDDVREITKARLDEKSAEWEAFDVLPTELIGEPSNYDRGHKLYGMRRWRDLFSPRQLLVHGTSVEVFRELLAEHKKEERLDDVTRAAFVYLALAIDKMIDYNARLSTWDPVSERSRHVFVRHNFSFIWQYAEMFPLADPTGYDWTTEQVGDCLRELGELLGNSVKRAPSARQAANLELRLSPKPASHAGTIVVSNLSGDALEGVTTDSIDAVVMDPPYYNNVMYAELADFFYVWLKRTAGHLLPELFVRQLTDKENEAVANIAKFGGDHSPAVSADRDYQRRMAAIFGECRRVLKPDGILTLMFTHKATGAWDALASGLMEAGFTITASWPVNTESEGSLHIKDKAAANSTIFLVCRPRPPKVAGITDYWEDVEPLVANAVRSRIGDFEAAGIRGVDLYLSCFGPALEEFAKHWPLQRGQPRPAPAGRSKRKVEGEALDPYAVTPEDALDAARHEVKKWKLDRLLRTTRHADLDPVTEWFILAWDAFKAPEFPYDEALRLARVVGVDLDGEIIKRLGAKKGSDIVLWDSSKRAASAAIGPPDGSRALIDALHNAAHRGRTNGLQAAREMLEQTKADQLPGFAAALTAVLEVLPVSSTFTHVTGEAGLVSEAASDFDVLEHLRRLAYSDRVREPEQLALWREEK